MKKKDMLLVGGLATLLIAVAGASAKTIVLASVGAALLFDSMKGS